jgi:hypothetical protein
MMVGQPDKNVGIDLLLFHSSGASCSKPASQFARSAAPIPLFQEVGRNDAIDGELRKSSWHQPISKRAASDRSMGLTLLLIQVDEHGLPARSYPSAHLYNVDAAGDFPTRRACASVRHEHDRRDPDDEITCVAGELRVTMVGHPLSAEHCGLYLVRGKHPRWKIKAAITHIPHPAPPRIGTRGPIRKAMSR